MNTYMKNFLISIINTYTPNKGRKCSKETEHYLDIIYKVLNSGCKWKHIDDELHYSTYYKKFVYWTELDIFKIAHCFICKIMEKNIGHHNFFKNMFIDSTDLLNKYGFEDVGYTFKFKNKKATRINIIVNDKGFPLSLYVTSANVSDSKAIEKTINNIPIKIIGSRKYPKYLTADKGYINEKMKVKLKKKGINLIYPLRKNNKTIKLNYYQKIKNKDLLHKRYINEHYFTWHKSQNRLNVRYDRKVKLFTSFSYFAALYVAFKKI